MALDELGKLYPDTLRVLLLAAKEALRPMGTETRLDGHTPAPIAVGCEVCVYGRDSSAHRQAHNIGLGN